MTPQERTDAQIAIALRDWLEHGIEALPDGMALPQPVRDQIVTQLPTTPQRRRGWSRRWSTRGRGALRSDDVPGDRESRRTNRMNGFAALLAAGAIGGAAVLAGVSQQDGGPRTIVVAQDGSGDATTITEGVALAVDGDTVLVRPGVYTESIIIDRDITLAGDGPREAVIIEVLADELRSKDWRVNGGYALQLDQTTSSVIGLTFRGEHARIVINGGAPRLEALMLDHVDLPYDGSSTAAQSAIHINQASRAAIVDSHLQGGGEIGIFDDSAPYIEGNVLTGGPHLWISYGSVPAAPIIRDNIIDGALARGIGIFAPTHAIIEGNQIDAAEAGIDVWEGAPVITGNEVHGADIGISVTVGSEPLIEGNVVHDNGTGILVAASVTVRDNTVRGNRGDGIAVASAANPLLEGNSFEGNATGLSVALNSTPVIQENRFCGNTVDHRATPPVPLPLGNEVCVPGASASPTS